MSDYETHPIGTARLIQEQAEELAMTKAFLALAEAQRDSLRKRLKEIARENCTV